LNLTGDDSKGRSGGSSRPASFRCPSFFVGFYPRVVLKLLLEESLLLLCWQFFPAWHLQVSAADEPFAAGLAPSPVDYSSSVFSVAAPLSVAALAVWALGRDDGPHADEPLLQRRQVGFPQCEFAQHVEHLRGLSPKGRTNPGDGVLFLCSGTLPLLGCALALRVRVKGRQGPPLERCSQRSAKPGFLLAKLLSRLPTSGICPQTSGANPGTHGGNTRSRRKRVFR